MKIKIAFHFNPAKEETKMVYCFDNVSLMRMDKALKP